MLELVIGPFEVGGLPGESGSGIKLALSRWALFAKLTGDVQLTMAQSAPLAGAIIVSTPQDLALIDARRGIAMFDKVKIPVLGIVENMSYFICPHCQGRSDIFAHGGARHEAEKRGVAFLGEVPLDIAIRETSDAGRPIVAASPDGAHAQLRNGIMRAKTQEDWYDTLEWLYGGSGLGENNFGSA